MKSSQILAASQLSSVSPSEFLQRAGEIVLGKSHQVQLALCTILAQGHLLIEDVPGVGKTTLVKFLAKALGLQPTRIQFTNDLLPADILGTTVYDYEAHKFRFHRGPIFGQLVIADELNRATPKTQSACLQAMEERKVSIDGVTYDLPKPFMVIATQNPREQAGTYPLPESQLDRFLMRISLGYPNREAERELLRGTLRQQLIDELDPLWTPEEVLAMQQACASVHVSAAIVDYVQQILEYSRTQSGGSFGLSPRAGLALMAAAKSWAFLEGRNMVVPDDVQAVGVSVMAHRLNQIDEHDSFREQERAKEILQAVRVD